jgi:hypothetical protein
MSRFVGAALAAIVFERIDARPALRALGALMLVLAASLASAAPPSAAREIVGKPTGPIAIRYEITPTPALGRTLEVSVTVTSAVALDNVTLSFAADEGLAFNTATTVLRVAHVASGAAYTATLSVTPLVLDVLEIVVTAEGDANGDREVGTALIPIRLAAAKSRSPATLKADPAGPGLVHSLPAATDPGRRAL